MKAICATTALAFYNSAGNGSSDFDFNSVDPTGTARAISICDDENAQEVDCNRAILEAVEHVDPTGLAGIAATFMHEECGV
jgi:hypothetical protein